VADKLVFKADVESRVRGRSEKLTCLADDVLRATVVIAHSVLDLYRQKEELVAVHNSIIRLWLPSPSRPRAKSHPHPEIVPRT
jgi:hypothetical protein